MASSRDQKLCAGHGPVGAGSDAHALVLEFGGRGAQQIRHDADIAVAHHQQIVRGLRQHEVQAVDLGVGVRRLTGENQARGNAGILGSQPLHHFRLRIVRVAHSKENFELR